MLKIDFQVRVGITGTLLFFIPLLLVSQVPQSISTDEKLDFVAESIRPADIRKHLFILASDEFAGRETGTEGNDMAARYIAAQFKKFGLKPVDPGGDYFQRIEFAWSRWDDIELEIGSQVYKHLWDYIAFPEYQSGDLQKADIDKIYFLGYGIDDDRYSDYRYFDLEGDVIMIYDGEPVGPEGISKITGDTTRSDWSEDLVKKLQTAYREGVRLVLIIDDDIQETFNRNRRRMLGPRIQLNEPGQGPAAVANHIYISSEMARKVLGKKLNKVIRARNRMQKKGKPRRVKVKTDLYVHMDLNKKIVESSNVAGLIEGSDTALSEEHVIASAHYDHLGTRGSDIYNGADDNASGSSTLLDIAQAMQMAREFKMGPRRSVLFLLVTGEEKGLLGSSYYADHPLLPLENAVANVNVDMIGRVDKKHQQDSNYIYVIGSDRLSTELHEINETANRKYTQLSLDYTFNAESDPNRFYYRSDHYNFAKKGVPAIFYFSGVHEDYHRPTDTPEKIMFGKTAKVGRLIFHTIWELANRDKRIEVDVAP